MGYPRYGSICLQGITPSPCLHVVETRSLLQSSKCLSTELGTPVSLCFPSILSNRKGTEKSAKARGQSNNNHTSMAISSMVPYYLTSNVGKVAYSNTSQNKLTGGSLGSVSSTNINTVSTPSGMDGLRKTLATEGIPKQAAMLITNARRAGTISNYELAWRKWSRQVDPFRWPLNYILKFLAELFTNGSAYRTINCHRSALSAYHNDFDRVPVCQYPRVTALMSVVFNKRPPQPKYTFTWNVEKVLLYIGKLYPNENLTDKDLTLKTTILLALTAASRSLEIKNLDLRFMTKSNNSYFTLAKLFKSWRKGKAPPSLEFLSFPTEKSLCVCESLAT